MKTDVKDLRIASLEEEIRLSKVALSGKSIKFEPTHCACCPKLAEKVQELEKQVADRADKHNKRLELLRQYDDGNGDLTDCIRKVLFYMEKLEKQVADLKDDKTFTTCSCGKFPTCLQENARLREALEKIATASEFQRGVAQLIAKKALGDDK